MHFLLRGLAVGIALSLWFLTQKLIGSKKVPAATGMNDRLHDWSAGWNQKLANSPRTAEILLILSSAGIDGIALFLLGRAIFGNTLEPLIGILLIFAMRQLVQSLSSFPLPQGIIWRRPRFPSLLVTYGVSNDLFFSGHTAIAVYGAYTLVHTAGPGQWVAATFGIALAIFEALTVLLLRAHWTADVFTGALAALWAGELASKLAPSVDLFFQSLTPP